MSKVGVSSVILSLIICALSASTAATAYALEDDPGGPYYLPFTITAEAGTTGVGGAANWRFASHLGVRGGMDYFRYSRSGDEIKGVRYNTNLRLMSEPLALDIYPWRNSSFRISVGALFNQNRLTGIGDGTGTIELDGTTYPAAAVGTLHLKIEQQPVNPYVVIGGNFFYFDKAHRWSLGGELGAMYTGNPKVDLTRSGGIASAVIDRDVETERQQVKSYAKRVQFWPVAKLGVNFSF